MSKFEFLKEVRKRLSGLPQDDIEERLNFYEEMIDDRIEEGLTEEQATSELGEIDDIVKQVMSEIPLKKLVKEKVRPSRALRAWEIVLLVLGSPVWLSLLIALLAVIVAVYAVIWSLIISLWAIEVSLAACALGGVFASAVFMSQGNIVSGLFVLGAGLICAGVAIFGFFGCKYAVKAILKFTHCMVVCIKSMFVKKEVKYEIK